MKVGFIGLGRMGGVMTRRLIDAGHEVGVYNRNADKAKPLVDAGAKALSSIKAAAQFGDAVFTMVSDDAAVLQVVGQPGGLKARCRKAAFTSAPARTASAPSRSSKKFMPRPVRS